MNKKKIISLLTAICLISLTAYAVNKFNETWFGGGYGDTGATIETTGNIKTNGTLTVDSTSTLTGTVSVGGGYGSTGISLSDAGVVQANGALTVDGASTLTGEVQAGGGYGSSGVTLETDGDIKTSGSITNSGTYTGTEDITCSKIGAVNTITNMVTQSDTGVPSFNTKRSRDNSGSPEDTQDDDVLGRFYTYGYASSDYRQSSYIEFRQDGALSGSNVPGKMRFVVNNGSTTVTPLNVRADGSTAVGTPVGATNYTKWDSTGHQTFYGTAKPWEDLRIEPTVRTVSPTTYNPVWTQWATNGSGSNGVYLYVFDDSATEKEIHFTAQMPHAWDGGGIIPHVHWMGQVNDTTSAPAWGLEYMFKDIGATFGNTSIVYTDGVNYTDAGTDANVTAKVHYMSKWATITPGATENGISAIMVGRLFRRSNDASDTYNATDANCALLYFDIHYQINSIGSTDEGTK